MSLFVRKPSPPHLNLTPVDSSSRETVTAVAASNLEIHGPDAQKPLPKSPGSSKVGTFFGWSSTSPSVTEFSLDKASDKGFSPFPSPIYSPQPTTIYTDDSPTSTTQGPYSAKTQTAGPNPLGYCEGYLQTPPAVPTPPPPQLEEMEDELKAISAELAASIRREMDLEDLVDRMQAEINNPQAPGRRTSDYFSDSGYSSTKLSEYDANKEEIAQVHRRAEQEKAQIRLELTEKLTNERTKRNELDQQIKELARKASNLDMAQLRSQDASGRVKDLENQCEDLRRRLSDERQVKNNFEDLLAALKSELRTAANERDNLRDEIVPQLRARVEGLEAQAADHAKLTYETTKIQQELQTLKTENTTLRNSQQGPSIATRPKANSITSQQPFKLQQPPLSRSNTVKTTESRDALAERLKDVEAQRDALHSALRSLLERQEFQNRENDKKIKALEGERDRLLSMSPGQAGYEKELSNLRKEIQVLRRRAEEAIEQKWQVEKGLSGLKMDLDRAEEEIAGLRGLLKEKDILMPAALPRSASVSSDSAVGLDSPVTSDSLERSYRNLQRSYAEALDRIKSLEAGTAGSQDERTKLAIQRLEQSLAASVAERDAARKESVGLGSQIESLQASEKKHLDSERDLASQLQESARRVEELAQQVRAQLSTNNTLRTRLNETVARGEAEQKVNVGRITDVQGRLRALEDQLVASQTAAEDRLARHEEEVAAMKESHATQLQRLRDTAAARSPLLSPASAAKSPLLSPRPSPRRSTTMPAADTEHLAQIETLRNKVTDLEAALATAEKEMAEVVGRMSAAQIEVMTLQEERENALRETRRLQREIEGERMKKFEDRFRTLSAAGLKG
jgi:chromosome segregation ATPase